MSQAEGHIEPHCGAREGKLFTRYHLVLDVPQPAAQFRICSREPWTFRPGVLFAFNNSQPHEVINSATEPRIVLLFDVIHDDLANDAPTREVTMKQLRDEWGHSLKRVSEINAAPSLASIVKAARMGEL